MIFHTGIVAAPPESTTDPLPLARLAPLLEIASLVRGDRQLDDVLEAIAETISAGLGWQTVAFNLYRPAWDDFQVTSVHGSEVARDALVNTTSEWSQWRPLLAEKFHRRGAYIIRRDDIDWKATGLARFVPKGPRAADPDAWDPKDALIVPLAHSAGHLLGILSVDEPASGRHPTDDELDLLTAVAAQAARALEHAQRQDDSSRAQAALEHLHEVSARLTGPVSGNAVLEAIAQGISRALGFERVCILLREGDGFSPVALAGWSTDDPAVQIRLTLNDFERLLEPQFEIEGSYLMAREDALARCGSGSNYASTLNGRGPWAWNRHWLLTPLRNERNELLGFLWVDDPDDRLLPSRERLRVLRMFANHAQTAFEIARTYTAEHEMNELLRASITASPLAIFGLDKDGVVRSWNPAAERLYGWQAEDLVGLPYPLTSPEKRLEFEHLFRAVLDGRSFSGLELVREARDGTRLDISASAAPLRDLDGEVTGAIILHEDITERKVAERQLERRHRELAALHDTTLDLVESLDEQAVLASIVERACELMHTEHGYVYIREPDSDELVLRLGAGAFSEHVGARLKKGEGLAGRVWQTREALAVDSYDTWHRRSERFEDLGFRAVAGVPLLSRRGLIGVLGLSHRDRKTFSAEDIELLEQFGRLASVTLENARLYSAVQRELEERRQAEERRHELEAQLRQSQKMESIGSLAGGIAHDFNNLLTAIAGYGGLALAATSEDQPELRRDIEEMLTASDRARQLIRQLLAFSRKQVLQPTVLDLNAVVGNMKSILERLIGDDVELVTQLDPNLGSTSADPGQIDQVLMNLCINARDAMHGSGGGQVVIETLNVDDEPGHAVALRVSDTGHGMTEDVRSRIFEPFFTTKEETQGTGLGLSTVYGIVKQSGGSIRCDSTQGEGTTFTVYLPRLDEEPALELRPEPAPVAAAGGSETILLTEDEPVVRKLVVEVLTRLGYTVLAAANGAEALELLREHDGSVDLLLTDLVMPEMNGRELAAVVCGLRPEMRVLLMSGYDENAVVTDGVLQPNAELLEKPFTATSLAEKVRAVLDAA